jgi:hypothetical protein
MNSPELSASQRQDLLGVSCHESGHELLAEDFGLDPRTFCASSMYGICIHSPGTAFQHAVVGWGGALAEDLLGARYFKRTKPAPPFGGLKDGDLPDWFDGMVRGGGFEQLSGEDQNRIGEHGDRWRTCETAFQILSLNKHRLWVMARLLFRESAERAAKVHRPSEIRDEIAFFVAERRWQLRKARLLNSSGAGRH